MKAAALVCVAGLALAGCASEQAVARAAKPYKVVLMPVSGAEDVPRRTPQPDGDAPLAYTMDPATLRDRIRGRILESGVFAEVETWDPPAKHETADERLEAAAERARVVAADLVLRVTVNSAGITDLGPNDRKYWSAFTWFMVPAPIWFADDRTYDTDLELRAELFAPDDVRRPAAGAQVRMEPQELDLWDRTNFEWKVLYTPPPWLEGDPDRVSATLTERAVDRALEMLVEELDAMSIPSRFDLDVALAAGWVSVTVGARRPLRSLEVVVNGRPLPGGTWSETGTEGIFDAAGSTQTRLVYSARVELPAAQERQEVRVIAEDESGNREVRTLVREGGR